MAGLLDYLAKGLGAIGKIGEGLGTADVAGDPAMLEMLTPEQRAAAQKRANLAGIAAMQEGAAKGLPWYAMTTARDFKADPAYNSFLANAVSSVEELRKRRDADGRRQKVAELVGRLSNPEDPLAQEYTPEQIAVLGAMSPDEQAALLAKTAFPKESGINVATSGTVQGGRFKLPNGNIGAMVQTGDPQNPVRIIDTGTAYISEDPSLIRGLDALLEDPRRIQVAGDLKKGEAVGTKTGEANVAAMVALPQAINAGRNALASMETFKAELAATPTGALTGRVLQMFNADFQKLEADAYSEALREIGRLKNEGVSLNPITENELDLLLKTSPRLTNRPEANIAIIEQRMERGRRALQQLEEQLAWIDAGYDITQYRPGQAPPSPAPVPRPQLRPGDVANPPPGGPGSVSRIPTIRKPGQ